jgi:hypothetical protein
MQHPITHSNFPDAISLLLAKVEGLERKIEAATAPPPQQPDHVTITEALSLLRGTVKRQTLYNWRSTGRISAKKVGRVLVFRRDEILQILEQGQSPKATAADAATSWDSVKPQRR